MCDRVLHVARMRALLLSLAITDDAPGVAGIGGLAMRALLDPAALSDGEMAVLADAMAQRQRTASGRMAVAVAR